MRSKAATRKGLGQGRATPQAPSLLNMKNHWGPRKKCMRSKYPLSLLSDSRVLAITLVYVVTKSYYIILSVIFVVKLSQLANFG